MTEMLDMAAVAARLGVTWATISRYRRTDRARYGFPPPDGTIGRSPWWRTSTIDTWVAQRPGRKGPA